MLGWINLMLQAFVVENFGEDAWRQIVAKSGTKDEWVSTCPYSDAGTYNIVSAASEVLGVEANYAIEAFGGYFAKYVEADGYGNLLRVLGSNLGEFLENLNNLHLHMAVCWPAMKAPSFRCEEVGPESLLLHYHSHRPGLWPLVVGVLRSMAAEYFGIADLGIELVAARHTGDCDHEIFRLTYPRQDLDRTACSAADAEASIYAMPPALFYRLFPFHLLLDEHCRLLQAGPALLRVSPSLAPGDPIVRHAKIHHPDAVDWDYESIAGRSTVAFLVLMRERMITLKGQMVPTTMPGLTGGPPRRVILFLGSPRCAGLEEMHARDLFLSDLPLHDQTADYLLLSEQRKAEADLKDRFERLAMELKVSNEKLEKTTQWLEEEKQRAEALLYRMSNLLAVFPAGPDRGGSGHLPGASSVQAAPPPEQRAPPQPSSSEALADPVASGAASSAVGSAEALMANYARSTSAQAGGSVHGGGGSVHGGSFFGGRRQSQTMERIEAVRRELTKANIRQGDRDDIECTALLGEGAYGKVYKGMWKGTTVAIKCVVLPANMSGQEKREKMAIMEAAISSALSHPSIMATYTYDIRAVCDSTGSGANGDADPDASATDAAASTMTSLAALRLVGGTAQNAHSFEVRLVLEYCDRGSLRDALDQGAFRLPADFRAPGPSSGGAGAGLNGGVNGPGSSSGGSGNGSVHGGAGVWRPTPGGLNYPAILDTAAEIAAAVHHLHGQSVLHSDLKARNIMLKSSGSEGRGVTSKVADFGLAVKMDSSDTHISGTYQGTMTHMAPEVMMHGRISKAADVYAFGVLLWEIYTAAHAFKGVPRALLGHQVTQLNRRPDFPQGTPRAYAELAERCWQAKAENRPTMEEVAELLKAMRASLDVETPPLGQYVPMVITRTSRHRSGTNPGAQRSAQPAPTPARGGLTSSAPVDTLGRSPSRQGLVVQVSSQQSTPLVSAPLSSAPLSSASGRLPGTPSSQRLPQPQPPLPPTAVQRHSLSQSNHHSQQQVQPKQRQQQQQHAPPWQQMQQQLRRSLDGHHVHPSQQQQRACPISRHPTPLDLPAALPPGSQPAVGGGGGVDGGSEDGGSFYLEQSLSTEALTLEGGHSSDHDSEPASMSVVQRVALIESFGGAPPRQRR